MNVTFQLPRAFPPAFPFHPSFPRLSKTPRRSAPGCCGLWGGIRGGVGFFGGCGGQKPRLGAGLVLALTLWALTLGALRRVSKMGSCFSRIFAFQAPGARLESAGYPYAGCPPVPLPEPRLGVRGSLFLVFFFFFLECEGQWGIKKTKINLWDGAQKESKDDDDGYKNNFALKTFLGCLGIGVPLQNAASEMGVLTC